jgi:hypothetical protein
MAIHPGSEHATARRSQLLNPCAVRSDHGLVGRGVEVYCDRRRGHDRVVNRRVCRHRCPDLANSRRRATRGSRPALLFARASEAVGLSDSVCPEAVGFRRAWTAVSPDETVTSAGLTPRGPRERSGAERGSRGGCVSGEAQRDGGCVPMWVHEGEGDFFDRRAARWYVRPGELVHDQRSRFGCWPSCLSLFSLPARTTVPAGAAAIRLASRSVIRASRGRH